MFVGHAFVAFALAASVADRAGRSRYRALQFGVVAGAFALVPDVDILYAVAGVLRADPSGVWAATAAFWDSSQAVHRAMTHSLVLAVPAAIGFGLAAASRRVRLAAALPLLGLVALGWLADGALAAAMLLLFVGAGVVVARGAARWGAAPTTVLAAAAVGLLSHPFGDLFTGTPPPLFFPLGPEMFGERVTLLADPTLNLLAVFGLELAAVWVGLLVAARLVGWSVRDAIDRRAAAGALYGAAAFVLPPPTLETSYHFVFTVLAMGSLGAVSLAARVNRRRFARAGVTALTAVTLAGAAYALVYALG
ncbi:MAG: metal-dependent hydrolase [Halobacteriales archaeon]|nr:metal-dependent hydrolase [Halobacteriales archaeon]